MFFRLFIVFTLCGLRELLEVDENGYIAYCPCMGRFGNQADHFLGVLRFAYRLDRTLILPPWVEYRQGNPKSIQVPFDTYFNVAELQQYHRVITMEQFMKLLAPTIWPVGNRTVFCYMARENTNDCRAKDGNPFGPFWDSFNVDFDYSEFYGPLHYDTVHQDTTQEWITRYNATQFPVLAFTGAPAAFPVQAENRYLHRYLVWNDAIRTKARAFVRNVLPRGAFVGIHLRNGMDWTRACEHVEQAPNLFAGPQCLGTRNEHGVATLELCFPSKHTILKQVKRAVKDAKAVAVFVASDQDYMLEELNHALKKMKVRAYWLDPADPHVELAILGMSNHFIGNCISTFSAFVKRERDVQGFPSSFWAFPLEASKSPKAEL